MNFSLKLLDQFPSAVFWYFSSEIIILFAPWYSTSSIVTANNPVYKVLSAVCTNNSSRAAQGGKNLNSDWLPAGIIIFALGIIDASIPPKGIRIGFIHLWTIKVVYFCHVHFRRQTDFLRRPEHKRPPGVWLSHHSAVPAPRKLLVH